MATLESRVSRLEDAYDDSESKSVFSKFRDDLRPIIAAHVTGKAICEAPLIAYDMGFKLESVLEFQDLIELSYSSDLSGISRADLRGFYRADLIMRVTDSHGQESYIAVEVSYTADHRDTSRAIRNAEYLERFTGMPARAAIAGLRRDREIEDIDPSKVFWYELPPSIIEVE